ncbi:hypothetical protein E1211_03035 [Micromonospora sp. 15K316]|uniref:hypothetical protein n=1 Tax=Micromonospora sp. 15K316 TaxID=2530376 RepID=UPI001052D450|nr:hypothetical protein [Micromonospora sp. 15K316]TDC39757.1 hypothetical protein E1211_03035 [Micromonospora sp. 15K316]
MEDLLPFPVGPGAARRSQGRPNTTRLRGDVCHSGRRSAQPTPADRRDVSAWDTATVRVWEWQDVSALRTKEGPLDYVMLGRYDEVDAVDQP